MSNDISVVIPVYNKEQTIARAIKSVLAQTHKTNDLVIIDDGSTDQSAKVITNLLSALPNEEKSRCRLIQTANSGVSSARNLGIQSSNSDYVALLDADDVWRPHHLANFDNLIEVYPQAPAWVSGYVFVDEQAGERAASWTRRTGLKPVGLFSRYFKLAARGDLPVSASSVCLSKSVLNQIGGFPLGQSMGEDQWVWSLLALKGDIAYTKDVSSEYYLNSQNSLMDGRVPTQELPFSAMLQDLIDGGGISRTTTRDIKQMIKTHLFDLIRRNVSRNKRLAASNLLSDPRLSLLSLRYWYWFYQCRLIK